MSKPLCEIKRLLHTNLKKYAKLVRKPTHLCVKCGRVANSKDRLCDPVKLKK